MKSYRFTFFSIVLFLSFMLMISTVSYAGAEQDIQEIKKGLSEVKEELKEIKRLLESPRAQVPTAPPAPALTESEASIDDDPILGKKNAPITIIEFSDYQCPFFSRFSRDTLPQIKTKDFNDCLKKNKYVREVKDNIKSGENAGVQGTPAFIVGKTTENGVIKGKFIKGAHPFQTFKTAIEELLKSTP